MKPVTNSAKSATDYDVIIVGGGPVGLLLGCLLKQQGLRLRVLERRAESMAYSAAIGITPPSLQILDKLGLAAEFVARGVQVRDCLVHGQRGRLGCVSFRQIPDAHRFILSLPQATTIAILQKHLGQEHFESGCEVSDVRQLEEHCCVQTGEHTLTARFVIACDGSRSRVREFIGMQAPSHVYDCHFAMGDFTDRSGFGDEAHLFFTETGAVESFPLPGGQRRWIVQTETHLDHPPRGFVSELIKKRTGIDVPAADQLSESAFTPRKFNCDRYYEGRIILCGDAAHGMSPIGGQGMNTGFADAEFLAAVLCHADPQQLLPAYNRFRRKAAKTAIIRAEWGMWLGTWRGKALSMLRDVLLKFLLCQKPVARHMGSFYAMLTIPFNTLERVPMTSLQPRRI
jgi:2-polyprenyl-6-methoxyphenol hydroxylase-like FAD-dependent oxidoreductase